MWPLFTGGERIRCFRAAAWKRKLSLRPLPIDRSGLPADLLEPRHVLGLFFRRVLHTRLNKKSYRDEFSIVTEKKRKRKKIGEEWNKKECCVNQNLLNSTRNLVEDLYRRKNWFFFFLFTIRLFVIICNIKMIYSRSFLFSIWTIWTKKSKKMNRILKGGFRIDPSSISFYFCDSDFIATYQRRWGGYLTIIANLFYIPVWSRVNPGEEQIPFEQICSRRRLCKIYSV